MVDWKGTQQENINNSKLDANTFSKTRRSTLVNDITIYSSSIKLSQAIARANRTNTIPNSSNEGVIQSFPDRVSPKHFWNDQTTIAKRSTNRENITNEQSLIPFAVKYENVLTISPSFPKYLLPIETKNCDYLYFMDSLLLTMAAISEASRLHGNNVLKNGRYFILL